MDGMPVGRAAEASGLAVGATAQRRAKLTEKAKLRPHAVMRKKFPDGVDLLDKIPARDKGAKEGDARAEADYCGAIDKVRRWSGHGGKGSVGGMPEPPSTRAGAEFLRSLCSQLFTDTCAPYIPTAPL